jgi:hypothetical protein
MDNKKQDVTFKKTGSNGVVQMEYKRSVVDFNTFIKAPEQYLKGKTVATNDKVSSKPGDKDYKQLIAKIKMVGERINVLGAMAANDMSKAQELNEAVHELNFLNRRLMEAQTEEAVKDAAQAPAQAAAQPAKTEIDQQIVGKVQEAIDKLPEYQKTQLFDELQKFTQEAGLSEADLGDPAKIQAALTKMGFVAESAVNEGKMGDLLRLGIDGIKKLVKNGWEKLGKFTMLGGLITLLTNWEVLDKVDQFVKPGMEQDIPAAVAAGAAALVIGAALYVYGKAKSGEFKKEGNDKTKYM